MNRDEAEKRYRQKFESSEANEYFELLYRNWESDHGRKCGVRCRQCNAEFETWAVDEYFRDRHPRIACPECGTSLKGTLWTRTPMAKEMEEYYVSGHSVTETAGKFGLSKDKVNSYVKQRKLTNGRDWREEAQKSNQKRKEEVARIYSARHKNQRIGYSGKYGGNLRARAKRHGCNIGIVPSLKKIFGLYDGECCICGKQCDFNSKARGGIGKDYPTRGHIIASANGGELDIKNIWLVCNECNYIHGSEDETHFLVEGGWTWDKKQKKYVRESEPFTMKH